MIRGVANPVQIGKFILEYGKVLTLSRKSSPSRNCIDPYQPCGALDWCCEGLKCDGIISGKCYPMPFCSAKGAACNLIVQCCFPYACSDLACKKMMQLECGMRLTDNPFSHSPATAGHRQLPQQPPNVFSEDNIDINLPSLISVLKSVGGGVFETINEELRKKLQSILPADVVVLKHIKSGQDVHLSRRIVATFLLIAMADFRDQFFGFQDVLFDNTVGMMKFPGNSYSTGLRPGDGKPRLWMNSISRMGAVHTLIMWEEQICSIEQSQSANINNQDEEIELVTSSDLVRRGAEVE
ncbi:hypothetical protein Tco_0768018 [Tanacetum coccineum]